MKRSLQPVFSVALLIAALPNLIWADNTQTESRRSETERVMPPASLTCERNQLTSYNGRITAISKSSGVVRLTILTDWDSVETVVLAYDGAGWPWSQFRLNGEAFDEHSQQEIESEPGTLTEGLRAIAWVCEDGITPTVIDWRPTPTR